MMRILFIIFLLIVFNGNANALEKFDSEDISLGLIATVTTVVDWGQTLEFTKRGVSEQNIFLGDHPSEGKINTMIGAAIISQWVVAWILPKEATVLGLKFNPRKTFQFGVIIGGSWAINHNYRLGATIEF